MVDISCSYNMNHSTIGMILRNRGRIKEHVKSAVPMILTIIWKNHGKVMEEMEKLLSVWMQDQHQRRVPLSLILIQEKVNIVNVLITRKKKFVTIYGDRC